jgi:hypothetical protein
MQIRVFHRGKGRSINFNALDRATDEVTSR